MKPIANFPGYFVTEAGEIFGPRGQLKGHPSPKGYLRVDLRNGEIKKTMTIHKIVLETFVGPRPAGLQARHKNGRKLENNLGNLCWGTATENYEDKRLHGTHQVGERHGASKLTARDVLVIREAFANRSGHDWGAARFAKQFSVHRTTISDVARRETWSDSTAIRDLKDK